MRNLRAHVYVLITAALCAFPATAQRGCFHSPEAPTGVLLTIGAVGVFYGSRLAERLLRRRSGK